MSYLNTIMNKSYWHYFIIGKRLYINIIVNVPCSCVIIIVSQLTACVLHNYYCRWEIVCCFSSLLFKPSYNNYNNDLPSCLVYLNLLWLWLPRQFPRFFLVEYTVHTVYRIILEYFVRNSKVAYEWPLICDLTSAFWRILCHWSTLQNILVHVPCRGGSRRITKHFYVL